jgi:hypothetical protein
MLSVATAGSSLVPGVATPTEQLVDVLVELLDGFAVAPSAACGDGANVWELELDVVGVVCPMLTFFN